MGKASLLLKRNSSRSPASVEHLEVNHVLRCTTGGWGWTQDSWSSQWVSDQPVPMGSINKTKHHVQNDTMLQVLMPLPTDQVH